MDLSTYVNIAVAIMLGIYYLISFFKNPVLFIRNFIRGVGNAIRWMIDAIWWTIDSIIDSIGWIIKSLFKLSFLAVIGAIGLGIYNETEGGAKGVLIILSYLVMIIAMHISDEYIISPVNYDSDDPVQWHFGRERESANMAASGLIGFASGVVFFVLGSIIISILGL